MTIARIGKSHWAKRGERIENARKWVGYRRQEDLAADMEEALGRSYSRTIISNIENGDRKLETDELTVLAHLLDQSEGWLNCVPNADFNPLAERRSPEVVRSLSRVPLSGRTVDYRLYPTVRAHSTTDRDYRPIDIHVKEEKIAA